MTALIWAYIPSFVPNSHSTQQAQSGIQKNQPQTNYEELKKSMTCCCWKTMSQARPSVKKCKLAKGIQSIWWVFFFCLFEIAIIYPSMHIFTHPHLERGVLPFSTQWTRNIFNPLGWLVMQHVSHACTGRAVSKGSLGESTKVLHYMDLIPPNVTLSGSWHWRDSRRSYTLLLLWHLKVRKGRVQMRKG